MMSVQSLHVVLKGDKIEQLRKNHLPVSNSIIGNNSSSTEAPNLITSIMNSVSLAELPSNCFHTNTVADPSWN